MTKAIVTRILLAVLCVGALGALFVGCTHDLPFVPDAVDAPATPDPVLAALRASYEGMDIAAYANLLHRDYRFIFRDPGKASFDREDDLASTGRMFSGVDQKNSAGGDAPAVDRIVFSRLEVLEGWDRVVGDEVDWSDETDVMRALIDYRFLLYLKNGDRKCASGRQIVYAVAVKTEDWDGSLYWRWQLLGQRDL